MPDEPIEVQPIVFLDTSNNLGSRTTSYLDKDFRAILMPADTPEEVVTLDPKEWSALEYAVILDEPGQVTSLVKTTQSVLPIAEKVNVVSPNVKMKAS